MVASRLMTHAPEKPITEAPAAADTKGFRTPKSQPAVIVMAMENITEATMLKRMFLGRRNLSPTRQMGIFKPMITIHMGTPVI